MNRTVFLIDGFNLYHSVRDAARAAGGHGTKWLNIKSLCESYLHLVGGQSVLVNIYYSDECDTAMLVTGDTDIAPAVRTAQRLFPDKTIGFAFPFGRKNKELAQLVPRSFQISKNQYLKNQFPPVVEISGRLLHKPDKW